MKKTQLTEIIRNIFRHKVSFLAIASIMLLGVGGILGLHFLGVATDRSISGYYHRFNFKDFEIVSNMGVTDKDIERIASVPGIGDVEGVFKTDAILAYNGVSKCVDALSVTERVSIPDLVQGALPSAANECAISCDVMNKMGIQAGDTVNILVRRTEYDGIIKEQSFTVTGAVNHPDYASRSSSDFLLLSLDAFDSGVMNDAYTGAFVRSSDTDIENVFDREYLKADTSLFHDLKRLMEELSAERGSEIKKEAEDKYRDTEEEADKDLSEAYNKLMDAQKELDEGLESGRKELEDGREELKNGSDKLGTESSSALKKLNKGEKELNEKLSDGNEEILNGEAEANDELDSALNELQRGEDEYSKGLEELAEGWRKYDDGVRQMEVAKAKLNAAKEQLDSGPETYNKLLQQTEISVNDLMDNMDPTLLLFENIIGGVEETIQMTGLTQVHPSWNDFKGSFEKIKVLKDKCKYTSGTEKPAVAFQVTSELRIFHELYANGIYDWLLSLGITDIPEPSELLSKIMGMENRLSLINNELTETQNKFESGQKEYDEAKKKFDKETAEADLDGARAKLIEGEDKLTDTRRRLDSGWDEYYRERDEARQKIIDARNEYEQNRVEGTDKLLSGWRDLEKGYSDAEKEMGEGTDKLIDEWKKYYEKKDEAGEEISSGWDEYYKEESEAKVKLAEARDELDNMVECNYIIQTRDINPGYAELKPYHDAITALVLYFSPLFAVVGSIVCFSTIAIIIEEHKKQVGTVKAFGFHDGEIRIKYMIFGIAATLIGCIAGIFVAVLIENVVEEALKDNFVFGQIPYVIVISISLIFVGITLTVSTLVVYLACKGLLKCTAIGLISGNEPKKRTMTGNSVSRFRTLYSKLIVNNALMDIERVLVSISVIAGSTILIGAGFTVYASVGDAHKLQASMNTYDFRVNVYGTDTEGLSKKVEEVLKLEVTEYMPATWEYLIYYSESGDGAMPVLCADPEYIPNFLKLLDYNGKTITPKSRGMEVRLKFRELEGLEKGDSFILCDNTLTPFEAYITDDYVNPIDLMAVISPEAYKAQFGHDNEVNCFYVRCNGIREQEVRDRLSGLSQYISIENSDSYKAMAETSKELCTILAVIMVVLSLLMSLMIMINLTNILVEHRMKELLIMRVNGFYFRQVIGYLLRESAFVTGLGLIIGIIVGVPFSTALVRGFEGRSAMYIRTPYVWVWAVSILFNLLFAVVIDSIAFRKVKKQPLTNIMFYS